MKCTEVRENMIEGLGSQPNAPVAAHLASCAECAQVWAGLQATFAAMDDWKSPEPSPFFQTRLNARLADVKWEESSAPTGIFRWLRDPVAAFRSGFRLAAVAVGVAAALALAVGVSTYHPAQRSGPDKSAATQVSPAVNDLQKLDKDEDLYADFELLDDLQPGQSQPVTTDSGSKTEL